MFGTYLNCEIAIGAPGPDGFALSVRGPGGDARGDLASPGADPLYQELAGALAAQPDDSAALDDLGRMLFAALFKGAVRDVYVRSQGVLGAGQGMRLTFNVDDRAAEVGALHWELLYDPDQGPLALLDMPVVRYLPQQAVMPTLRADLPLKVLLTGAETAPGDDVGRGLEAIQQALARLSDYVQITVEPHLTFAQFQKLLRQGFHVWHFVGHADVDARGMAAQIYFEDANRPRPIDARQLNILLNRSGVRLALLDTIRAGDSTAAPGLALDPLRQLAIAVVRAQVPAAIATQFTAHAESAQAFSEEFYRALAEGFPIDACVTEGRKAVMSAVGLDRIDWASPVVYTRAPDGKLFDLPSASAPDVTGQIVSPAAEGWRGGAVSVNGADGALLYAAGPPRIDRLAQKPRAPRRVRGFRGRDRELAQIAGELQPGGGAWLFGPSGCGMSALLREAANTPAAAALPDGVAYVEGGAEPPFLEDITQRLFERFYAASPPVKVSPEAARTALSNVQGLFVLDSPPLNGADARRLTDSLADSAVLVGAEGAGPDTLLRLQLGGLRAPDAIALCAAAVELGADESEVTGLLERLAGAVDNLPLPLLLLGRVLRRSADGPEATLSRAVAALPEIVGDERDPMSRAIRIALGELDADEQAVLFALASAGGPDADLAAIAAAANLPAEASLSALARLADLGLVESNADRFGLASLSLKRTLARLAGGSGAAGRLAAFYAAAAQGERSGGVDFDQARQLVALAVERRGDMAWLARERANLMAAIETLLELGLHAQAGAIARALQPLLVLRGLWGCWGQVVGWAEQAARASGDRGLLAWALHERGTRAGLNGQREAARADLVEARRIRLELGDRRGAAATLHNMSYLRLLPPSPPIAKRSRSFGPPRLLMVLAALLLALGTAYGASAAGGLLPRGLVPSFLAAAPTMTPTPAPTVTTIPTATARPIPTATATPSPKPSPTRTSTPSATATPEVSPTPSATATPEASPTPSATPAPTPTATAAPVAAVAAACKDMGRAVIAFYYAWFDMGDWQKGTTSTGDLPDPLYDGGDETALNRHLQQAEAAGIDALACAWKGPGDKTTTQRCKKLLDLAAARGGKVKVAMFADQADTGWFVGSEGAMVKAIELLKSDFMPSPAYLRVGDRPVVLAWLAHSLGGPDAWQRVRGQVDPENKQFWMAGTDQFQYLDSFDALFYFDISWESKPGAAMASYAGRLSRYNQSSGAGKPFVATVQAGYDDTLNRGPGHKVVPHTADAAYYKQTWQAAIDRRACATVLTSFNEFFEGSYIEPSAQFGKTYLDVTGQMTAQYKTAP